MVARKMKTKTLIAVRLDRELDADLKEIAMSKGETQTAIIERALTNEIERMRRQSKTKTKGK